MIPQIALPPPSAAGAGVPAYDCTWLFLGDIAMRYDAGTLFAFMMSAQGEGRGLGRHLR